MDEVPYKDNARYRIVDHSGYAISDLFVVCMYKNLKEEMMNYPLMDIATYQQIWSKAKIYSTSRAFKSATACLHRGYAPYEYYGIEVGSSLGFENLLCILMYTDLTNLSGAFTSTFRKKDPWESLSSIKRRNSRYFHWSKILRETVECYGMNWPDLMGPFYTGMSFVMTIPQFQMRLCSPTSTSVQLEVAMKFGGDDGLIMQMNNEGHTGFQVLSAFDCSIYSQYKEEDERYNNCILYFILFLATIKM